MDFILESNVLILSVFDTQIGFKGYGIPDDKLNTRISFEYEGQEYGITHGSVLIAAICSSTNSSNPSVLLGAGKQLLQI